MGGTYVQCTPGDLPIGRPLTSGGSNRRDLKTGILLYSIIAQSYGDFVCAAFLRFKALDIFIKKNQPLISFSSFCACQAAFAGFRQINKTNSLKCLAVIMYRFF